MHPISCFFAFSVKRIAIFLRFMKAEKYALSKLHNIDVLILKMHVAYDEPSI